MSGRVVLVRDDWETGVNPDFRDLAIEAGFAVCRHAEVDLAEDAVYVVVAREPVDVQGARAARARCAAPRAKLAFWFLERPDFHVAPYHVMGRGFDMCGFVAGLLRIGDAVWAIDRGLAATCPGLGHALLGSGAALAPKGPRLPPAWDACLLANAVPRRVPTLRALAARFRIAQGAWGDDRDRVLRSSRIMVSIHGTAAPVGEWHRYALAAAHGLPLVAEAMADPWPLVAGEDFVSCSLDEIPDAVAALLADEERASALAAALRRRLFDEWTFRRGVQTAIRQSGLDVTSPAAPS